MAQTPRGGLYEPPCKGHLEVCAIYSGTTVYSLFLWVNPLMVNIWFPQQILGRMVDLVL